MLVTFVFATRIYPASQLSLASCSFDKLRLVLIIFSQVHKHAFRSDVPIQISLSLHF